MHQFYQETEEKAEEKGGIKSVGTEKAEPRKKRNRRGAGIKIHRYLPLRSAEVSECSFNNNWGGLVCPGQEGHYLFPLSLLSGAPAAFWALFNAVTLACFPTLGKHMTSPSDRVSECADKTFSAEQKKKTRGNKNVCKNEKRKRASSSKQRGRSHAVFRVKD